MYDVNTPRSFDSLTSWRDEFLIQASPRDPESFPFVVIGNKTDLGEGKREVSAKRGQAWAREKGGLPYFECSAKEGSGVLEAFECVARNAMGNQDNEMADLLEEPFPVVVIEEGGGCAC